MNSLASGSFESFGSRMDRERLTIIACIYVGYILMATLYPFDIPVDSPQSVTERLSGFWRLTGKTDLVLNVLLFVPLGIVLFFRFAASGAAFALFTTTLVGVSLSTLIEFIQIFSPARVPAFFDILANGFGTALGCTAAMCIPRSWAQHRISLTTPTALSITGLVLLFGAVPLALSFVQYRVPFNVWNPGFSFQIGNEPSLDRPWLGTLYSVAVYNRALSPEQVRNRFHQGFYPQSAAIPDNVIAFYRFNEGAGDVAQDASGNQPALDLTVYPPSHIHWLSGSNGIEIHKPAILKNEDAGAAIADAANRTQELSIEVWMTTRDTTQTGPARIISFSRNTAARNFTLGQEGSEIQFRLRTPVSGRNGTPLALTAPDAVSTLEPSHIVATYRNGVETLYVNGELRSPILHLTHEGIIGFGTGRTWLAFVAYSFIFFFPATFISAAWLAAFRKRSTLHSSAPPAIGAALLVSTEVFQVFAFARSLEPVLLICGIAVILIAARSGIRIIETAPRFSSTFGQV